MPGSRAAIAEKEKAGKDRTQEKHSEMAPTRGPGRGALEGAVWSRNASLSPGNTLKDTAAFLASLRSYLERLGAGCPVSRGPEQMQGSANLGRLLSAFSRRFSCSAGR